ncbi:MAG: 4-hydroxy-tetrahydrodipicolinate synthase [Rhizobiaceae bacterium]|nr:4-hydroxy-tetrahydrodipicolinate synthase [Rhizobiaceae bacterium]
MFRGSIPALITPFNADGGLDERALREYIEWQISEGSHGLVPVGTTGESPTLSHEEHKRVVEICVEVANKRVPVIAGAGSNSTAEAVDLAKFADQAGADGVLVVTPYYNKPNQRGMIAHFGAIAEAISIPLIIYNIPGRSIVDMNVDTMAHLFKTHKNIVGVKDATGTVERVSEQRGAMGPEFIQLTGNDDSALGFMAHGGAGCISVSANVAPRLCAEFQEACMAGRFADALSIQDKLAPLHKALFLEPNPGGTKYALSLLGKVENNQRLPLVPIESATQTSVREAMVHAGLLN